MTGRETREQNDLFYVCSLIDYIARVTKNHRSAVVDALQKDRVQRILELADVYHCDNIERVSDDLIQECGLSNGSFDNVGACRYAIPSHWDIGKVYKRLILMIAKQDQREIVDVLIEVYHSWICQYIDDYNGSFYYENPQFIYESYRHGEVA